MTDRDLEGLVIGCLAWSLEDSAWQSLGFPKRPKRGSIFLRFVPKWKLDLEERILRELVFIGLSHQILSNKYLKNDIDFLIRKYGSNRALPNCYEDYGYASNAEAVEHCAHALNEYLSNGSEDWSGLLLKRLEWEKIVDYKLKARIVSNSIQLCVKFNLDIQSKK